MRTSGPLPGPVTTPPPLAVAVLPEIVVLLIVSVAPIVKTAPPSFDEVLPLNVLPRIVAVPAAWYRPPPLLALLVPLLALLPAIWLSIIVSVPSAAIPPPNEALFDTIRE